MAVSGTLLFLTPGTVLYCTRFIVYDIKEVMAYYGKVLIYFDIFSNNRMFFSDSYGLSFMNSEYNHNNYKIIIITFFKN